MLGNIGVTELVVILAILLLLFGAKKLPDLAAGLGGAVNNFKKAMRGDQDDQGPRTLEGRQAGEIAVPKPTSTDTKV
jgi:sec-independent protein translocase protein TatA